MNPLDTIFGNATIYNVSDSEPFTADFGISIENIACTGQIL